MSNGIGIKPGMIAITTDAAKGFAPLDSTGLDERFRSGDCGAFPFQSTSYQSEDYMQGEQDEEGNPEDVMQGEGQRFGKQAESDRLHDPKLGDAKAGK
jgi:hypothetical protein